MAESLYGYNIFQNYSIDFDGNKVYKTGIFSVDLEEYRNRRV